MIGYVTAAQKSLKSEEIDVYRAFYCGVCKAIAERYGTAARLALSYDAVFLAMLISSVTNEKTEISREHCILHHIEKKPVLRDSGAVDYAADMTIVLAYHKLLDDTEDERGAAARAKTKAAHALLKGPYRKAYSLYPAICDQVSEGTGRLRELEAAKSPSIDETADASASITRAVFGGYFPRGSENERIFTAIGDYVGKWVYIIDALDDLHEDIKNDCYNPFRYRQNGTEGILPVLYNLLGGMSDCLDLLEIKENKGIIDNVLFISMRARTEMLAGPENKKDERSI